jgi:hypothetical protein
MTMHRPSKSGEPCWTLRLARQQQQQQQQLGNQQTLNVPTV